MPEQPKYKLTCTDCGEEFEANESGLDAAKEHEEVDDGEVIDFAYSLTLFDDRVVGTTADGLEIHDPWLVDYDARESQAAYDDEWIGRRS